ncbi:hypothetical protein SAMN05444161_7012 [Rhizobiales bacterium GAS191]|nr:hypothetical protein SAMN05444161_7012 [Rhizobiales bacterium GAS191]
MLPAFMSQTLRIWEALLRRRFDGRDILGGMPRPTGLLDCRDSIVKTIVASKSFCVVVIRGHLAELPR